MRQLAYIVLAFVSVFSFTSCDKTDPVAEFEDLERQTIYDFIVEKADTFSMFLKILEAGKLDKTLSAYNPDGNDYTLFLPTNEAIEAFIRESGKFASFDDLLKDATYTAAMARYHVVNMGIITNDFPFGALPELNLSGQYLTIGFVVEKDTSYYKVNNVAPISLGNIETSNGYIHVITKALTPITFTTSQWLAQNPDFSIFNEAVKATGFDTVLNFSIYEEDSKALPVTLLVEPDSVYKRNNIFSVNDLAKKLGAIETDYKNPYNPVNIFVGYHILQGNSFLADFEGKSTNYISYADAPVLIDGKGVDLAINKGKTNYDTLVSGTDTTFVNYITFYYDYSNLLTQSGAIHIIDQVMTRQSATPARQYFQFFEEPLFSQYRQEIGTFIVDDPKKLSAFSWTGGNDQLIFVKTESEDEQAWGKDYIGMYGDFTITYKLPRIVQGTYDVAMRVHAYSSSNALVEVFLDGVKIGGLIDLTTGGNNSNPYYDKKLGSVTFLRYEPHTFTVKTLIPGVFIWDYVDFNPVTLK